MWPVVQPEQSENSMADLQTFAAVNIAELKWKEWSHGKRYGGKTKAIADAAGAQKIGVVLEELLPGQQSSPPHYHLKEEEHIWIIRGKVTLRLGGTTHLLQAGHYVCFLAGVDEPHCLINESDAPCLYLVVGEKIKEDIVVYPESNKISVRLLGKIYKNEPVDYWQDDEQ
jgi:uncharacterized cupin superfamily protein